MFKNIEYDLLNISRQMEAVTPNSQIECFVVASKDIFHSPIISIYAEGPIMVNRYTISHLDTKSSTSNSRSNVLSWSRRCCVSIEGSLLGFSKIKLKISYPE
jgi:hypothetical protein